MAGFDLRTIHNMEITERLHTTSREQWREWLTENHSTKREIWISTTKSPDGLQYLDAVEEALCFGWIDSTIKAGEGVMWRRFSPRRKRSPWTELNKERCRRLERLGLMTDAGRAVLPDMDFQIDDDVLAALQSDKTVWQNFQLFLRYMCEYASTTSKISASEILRLFNAAFKNSSTTLVMALCTASGMMMENCLLRYSACQR